jgi:hypothetical protein
MIKSEVDNLRGRNAELRDELYNARHEKTKSDVNLKLAVERVSKLFNLSSYLTLSHSDRKTSTRFETLRRSRCCSTGISTA